MVIVKWQLKIWIHITQTLDETIGCNFMLPTCLCVYSGKASASCTHSRCIVRVAQLCLITTANHLNPSCFIRRLPPVPQPIRTALLGGKGGRAVGRKKIGLMAVQTEEDE